VVSVAVPAEAHRVTYRGDIDGLRAPAVLAVIGFHAAPRWIPGGFAGVDVFFVISGFLISGLIFDELRERDSFDAFEFHARRIRRIFPALIVVLLAGWVIGWFVLARQAPYRAIVDEVRQCVPALRVFDPLPYLCDDRFCFAVVADGSSTWTTIT